MRLKAMRCLLLLLGLSFTVGCGDSRPDAAGAAHLYNSTEVAVQVQVKPAGAGGATYTLTPGEGQFVPLRKADNYVVSVVSPPRHASYRQQITVPADDKTDTVFDIGSAARFAIVPTYHVPKDMPDMAARAEVQRIIQLGEHRDYHLNRPAPKHVLPRGVYYTFGDEVETISRLTVPGRDVEVRYKLAATSDGDWRTSRAR